MNFEEALTRSPIKTVRVSTRGHLSIKTDYPSIATPLIIRELSNGWGKACYKDVNNKFMKFDLYPDTYERIKQDCLKMDLYCQPLDE